MTLARCSVRGLSGAGRRAGAGADGAWRARDRQGPWQRARRSDTRPTWSRRRRRFRRRQPHQFDAVTLTYGRGGPVLRASALPRSPARWSRSRARAAAASRRSRTHGPAARPDEGTVRPTAKLNAAAHRPAAPRAARRAGPVLFTRRSGTTSAVRPEVTAAEVGARSAAGIAAFIASLPAGRTSSGIEGSRSRPANGSASRWRGRSWRIPQCWCSTSRAPRSTRSPSGG